MHVWWNNVKWNLEGYGFGMAIHGRSMLPRGTRHKEKGVGSWSGGQGVGQAMSRGLGTPAPGRFMTWR